MSPRLTASARVLAALALGLMLSACAERPQDLGVGGATSSKAKADTKPWQADSTAYATGDFAKGDQKAWEQALRQRAQSQNEYTRSR